MGERKGDCGRDDEIIYNKFISVFFLFVIVARFSESRLAHSCRLVYLVCNVRALSSILRLFEGILALANRNIINLSSLLSFFSSSFAYALFLVSRPTMRVSRRGRAASEPPLLHSARAGSSRCHLRARRCFYIISFTEKSKPSHFAARARHDMSNHTAVDVFTGRPRKVLSSFRRRLK